MAGLVNLTPIEAMRQDRKKIMAKLETLSAENAMLREALEEIAERGPIDGYSAPSAILLRLVGSQSVARAALAKGE